MAENGAEALDLLPAAAENGEAYDLAVLDMQMPDMDGIQLARAISAEPAISSTRLVLLTSIGININETARMAGVEVVLNKPVRQSQLHDALATPDLGRGLVAVHLGHLNVHEHRPVRDIREGLDGLPPVVHGVYPVA